MSPEFPLIIADESVDARIILALRQTGFIVFSIANECAGISDLEVIQLSILNQGFILTEDKDFGDEIVYKGVSTKVPALLLRISELKIDERILLIKAVFLNHSQTLLDSFSVLSAKKLRIRKYEL
jgi:predicted nuclease of predicted toxin-antitoxin system